VTDGEVVAGIVKGSLAAFLKASKACPKKDYPCVRYETYFDTATALA
jgi:hypothetical protein